MIQRLEYISNVPELFEISCRKNPQNTAYIYLDPDSKPQRVSWETLEIQVRSTSNSLLQKGVSPGDIIAILAPTCHLWHILYLAVLRVRAVVLAS